MSIFEEVRTVTADGRVVVPWIIQRALGLDHGGPVRFRVVDGVVTLLAVDARKPAPASRADQPAAGRTDIRRELAVELNRLLAVSGRSQSVE